MYFQYFVIFFPLIEGLVLYLNNLELSLPNDGLCQVWLKLAQWFWRRFLNSIIVFLLICNYLPLERGITLHMNKHEIPWPKDILCQVGWNLNFVNVVLLFCNNLPLQMGITLHMNKHEIPSPKDACAKFGWKSFWRRIWKFEKFTHRQIFIRSRMLSNQSITQLTI